MTQEPTAALSTDPSSSELTAKEKQVNIQEILESFKIVTDDIDQISKLNLQEKNLVKQFFELLQKHMQPLASSIEVSPSVLPIQLRGVTQAQLYPTGHVLMTFEDEHKKLVDLSEAKYRDLMIVVVGDVIPKIGNLVSQRLEELEETQTQEAPIPKMPEPEILPAPSVETPISLPDLAPAEVPQEVPSPEILEAPVTPNLLAEKNGKILELENETLGYLEQLGGEVFERSPVSMYFDDWMVNIRQIIVSFESSEFIGPDETFTNEYNQIFGEIEEELGKILANEAEIEVSAKALVENRYLLNKIDDGYAAQTMELVVKGRSAIDYLIRNVNLLEAELSEVDQIKTSYLHPLKKLAKDQKLAELTQKLNASKKSLAVAVGNSSVDKGKVGDIDAQYAVQTKELAEKRKSAIDFLTKNVQDLEAELAQIQQTKTSSLHFLKKVAEEDKQIEITEKLNEAKKRLRLAEQNSGVEQEKLNAEYEKKKVAMITKMQTLENEIATKQTDNSAEARRKAANALANSVKSLVQRKTAITNAQSENPVNT